MRKRTLPAGNVSTTVIPKELIRNVVVQPDNDIVRQEREFLAIGVVPRVSFLLQTRARYATATTVAVVQLAMAVNVVVLEVIQNVPDVGRRRLLLLVAVVVQSDPAAQMRGGVLLLPTAVFLI